MILEITLASERRVSALFSRERRITS